MVIQELDYLMMPKFKYEFFVPLKKYLQEMGIKELFDDADLSGIYITFTI